MYSSDLKLRAIQLYNKFNSYRLVAELLNIGKSTIHRWVNNINNKKNIIIDNKLIVSTIQKLLDKNPFISISKIHQILGKKFNRSFSNSLIYTIIKKTLKYSYKKISKKLYGRSLKNLFKLQNSFIKSINNLNIKNIISIDETYIHSNYCVNYGWSKIGSPLIYYKKSNPIKYSILMAISINKVVSYKIYNKNINSQIFFDFINELNSTCENHYFLMDNVKFHKSKNIKNLFESSSNKLLYIPPYSPQYNPIEQVFSQMKRHIKNSTNKNIIQKIKGSIRNIKKNHLFNYYNHCFTNC